MRLNIRRNLKIPESRASQAGTTLIEALIAIAIFIILVVPIYWSYSNILDVIRKNQSRTQAMTLIQNELETVRNMPYDQVGIQGGFPPGQLLANQTVNYQNNTFTLQTFVRNIDDPFDGLAPTDTTPADYKLVEITATCLTCSNSAPLTITSTEAPKSLESASSSGSLFVNVFDANGNPISLANVQVINSSLIPAINISDTTGLSGVLQLIGLPTSTSAYQVFVSKPSYSSDQTYPPGAPSNPNPVKPNATVAAGLVTSVSFAIDRVSTFNIQSRNNTCQAVANIPFSVSGTKLIGTSPNILKYSTSSQTDLNGQAVLHNIEWDTYNFNVGNGSFDLSGNSPVLPLIVNPSSTYQLNWNITPRSTSSILVTVQDASNTLINNASVNIANFSFNQTTYTGRRPLSQNDWSRSSYTSQSGTMDPESVPGQITLLASSGLYPTTTPNWLISNTIDFGTASTTFYNFDWQPINQPVQAGLNSLEFQTATNNDNATWSFIGPDGTSGSYYTSSSASLNPIHNGNRYLRYKINMQTQNPGFTPTLTGVTFNFSSPCIPNGQAFLNGIPAGAYTITIQAAGYGTYSDPALTIGTGWQSYNATISP